MTDQDPNEPTPAVDELIDFSGTPRSMGEQRDHGFRIMKARMLEIYSKKNAHVQPMIRAAKMGAYSQALDDAFNVFAQVVEPTQSEELTPGL